MYDDLCSRSHDSSYSPGRTTRGVPVGLFLLVPVFIVHKYRPVLAQYFNIRRPRAVSSANGSIGV